MSFVIVENVFAVVVILLAVISVLGRRRSRQAEGPRTLAQQRRDLADIARAGAARRSPETDEHDPDCHSSAASVSMSGDVA
jgi:hypothetical protein